MSARADGRAGRVAGYVAGGGPGASGAARVLLLGGSGLLGSAFRATAPSSVRLTAPSHAELDATDARAVAAAVGALRPDWILMCAAYTAVDRAESEPERARALNVDAVARVAAAARHVGARVLLPSTDYVFDGNPGRPWRPEDPTNPRTVYARSKRDGELALWASGAEGIVLRTSWLFGHAGKSFPRTMYERATARQPSRVVHDQHGAPTSVRDLAEWSWVLLALEARGTLHAANRGETTWFEVAQRIYARVGFAAGVTAVATSAYPTPAQRPSYSVLDCAALDALLPSPRRPWQEALDEYLAALPVPAT